MMENNSLSETQVAALSVLANGIIPADETDTGAAEVDAGPRLAQKVAAGINAALYRQGIEAAEAAAREQHASSVNELNPDQVHLLVGTLKSTIPAFYKQLRMDVSALYLSDPDVWKRIGFPGPSSEQGGYPDFDQVQRA